MLPVPPSALGAAWWVNMPEIRHDPEHPTSKEAAATARALVKALVDGEGEYFELVWGDARFLSAPVHFVDVERPEQLAQVAEADRWRAALVANLAGIAAVANSEGVPRWSYQLL